MMRVRIRFRTTFTHQTFKMTNRCMICYDDGDFPRAPCNCRTTFSYVCATCLPAYPKHCAICNWVFDVHKSNEARAYKMFNFMNIFGGLFGLKDPFLSDTFYYLVVIWGTFHIIIKAKYGVRAAHKFAEELFIFMIIFWLLNMAMSCLWCIWAIAIKDDESLIAHATTLGCLSIFLLGTRELWYKCYPGEA